MNKKIAFITLGCKLNYAETSTYERAFLKEGFEAVPWNNGADIFLVNTCSVTEHSDKKSRNIIRKLHRISPDAPIIVTGCYAQLKKKEIEAIEGVTFVFGAAEKSRLVPEVLAYLNNIEARGEEHGTFSRPIQTESARGHSSKCRTAATTDALIARFLTPVARAATSP